MESISKSQKDTQSSWMDSVYSSTTSVFAKHGGLDGVSTKVGLSFDLGIRILSYDERVCDKYGARVIPIYEWALSITGLRLPFTALR